MLRFNGSPCRCRSEQTPVNRGNKTNTLFKRKLLQQKKEGTYRLGTLEVKGTLEAVRPAIKHVPLHYRRLKIQFIKFLQAFRGQLRDTRVLKQQCSHQTTVVAPEHSNRKRQYNQSSCPRAVHNLRRLKSRLGCLPLELSHKWSLISSGSQRSYRCS